MTAESVACDHTLSLAARGLYSYLVAFGPGPRSADAIAEAMRSEPGGRGGEGRRGVREAMAQLVDAGLVTRRKVKDASGRWSTEIHVEADESGHRKRRADNADVDGTDVPACGTSASPAQTNVLPSRTDVPLTGMSVRLARMHVLPAHTDVPHGGTLSTEAAIPATTVAVSQGQDLNPAAMSGDPTTTDVVEPSPVRTAEPDFRCGPRIADWAWTAYDRE